MVQRPMEEEDQKDQKPCWNAGFDRGIVTVVAHHLYLGLEPSKRKGG